MASLTLLATTVALGAPAAGGVSVPRAAPAVVAAMCGRNWSNLRVCQHPFIVEPAGSRAARTGEHKFLVGLSSPPLSLDNRADPWQMGFRDEARFCRWQERKEARRGRGQVQGCSETTLQVPDMMPQPEADITSIISIDSAASMSCRRLEICGDVNKTTRVFASLDTMSTNYTITSCSDSFGSMCKTSGVGQGFMAWPVDMDNFESRVKQQVNSLLYDSGRAWGEAPGMQVALLP